MPQPSLYEMLTGHFSGGLPIDDITEEEQVILSVMDNISRILNARAGSLPHLPDYGLVIPPKNNRVHKWNFLLQ